MILSPTRELAMQTWKEANKFAISLGINVVCVYGGVGISDQIADLKKGAEVIVCTPGRMIDMLAANNGIYIYIFLNTINKFRKGYEFEARYIFSVR